MKQTFALLLACCASIGVYAQAPQAFETTQTPQTAQAAETPQASQAETPQAAAALQFSEPEFIGDVVAILSDNTTRALLKENMSHRTRSTTSAILFDIGQTKNEMVVEGPKAHIRLKMGDGIAFIVKAVDNSFDPLSEVNVFRFKPTKKERRAEYASINTLGNIESNKLQRQSFTARRFGASSYLLILQNPQPGEYGITVNGPAPGIVSTFAID